MPIIILPMGIVVACTFLVVRTVRKARARDAAFIAQFMGKEAVAAEKYVQDTLASVERAVELSPEAKAELKELQRRLEAYEQRRVEAIEAANRG